MLERPNRLPPRRVARANDMRAAKLGVVVDARRSEGQPGRSSQGDGHQEPRPHYTLYPLLEQRVQCSRGTVTLTEGLETGWRSNWLEQLPTRYSSRGPRSLRVPSPTRPTVQGLELGRARWGRARPRGCSPGSRFQV